jgi:hypothetical protein
MNKYKAVNCPWGRTVKDICNQGHLEFTCVKCGSRNEQPCFLSDAQIKEKEKNFALVVKVLLVVLIAGFLVYKFAF